jgi:hypothetical protein
MKGSFKTALIAAVVSAFVAAGAAVATTQAFTLGTTNRVDAPSSVVNATSNGVTHPVDAPLLTLNNRSSTANATPLSLLAASGHAPFKVNTQAKVNNLNADQLDGKDSSAFIQGKGLSNADVLVLSPTDEFPEYALLSVPGLGTFSAFCGRTPTYVFGSIHFNATAPGYLSFVTSNLGAYSYPESTTDARAFTLSIGSQIQGNYSVGPPKINADQTTWQISSASGDKVASAVTSIVFDDNGNCVLRASYVENG